jgi:hypothetical protein
MTRRLLNLLTALSLLLCVAVWWVPPTTRAPLAIGKFQWRLPMTFTDGCDVIPCTAAAVIAAAGSAGEGWGRCFLK